MAAGGRRRDDARKEAERRVAACPATSSCWSSTASTRTCSASSRTANIHSPEDLIKTPIEHDRDHDRHRHGRSRAAPPARDQLAVGGVVLTSHVPSAPASGAAPVDAAARARAASRSIGARSSSVDRRAAAARAWRVRPRHVRACVTPRVRGGSGAELCAGGHRPLTSTADRAEMSPTDDNSTSRIGRANTARTGRWPCGWRRCRNAPSDQGEG